MLKLSLLLLIGHYTLVWGIRSGAITFTPVKDTPAGNRKPTVSEIHFPGSRTEFGDYKEGSQLEVTKYNSPGETSIRTETDSSRKSTNVRFSLTARVTHCPGECRPLVQCAPYQRQDFRSSQICVQPNGERGACCREHLLAKSSPGAYTLSFSPQTVSARKNVTAGLVTLSDLDLVGKEASATLERIYSIQSHIQASNLKVKKGTPSFRISQSFKPSAKAETLAKDAIKVVIASQQLKRCKMASSETAEIINYSVKNTDLKGTCVPDPYCTSQKYRTMDGSCNNLKNPKWGMALTPLQRFIDPSYEDGLWKPRKSVDGNDLPSPRLLSIANFPDRNSPYTSISVMVMQWGQFLDHDITHVPIFKLANDDGIECCSEDGKFLPRSIVHPYCFPIEIPAGDPHYSKFDRRCMNFVRSMPAPRIDCTFGWAEQMNELSHFIDGSNIYGSSAEYSRVLRAFKGGRLRTLYEDGQEWLPLDLEDGDCTNRTRQEFCYRAGDKRVNEQPGLTVMHTLWMREHNRIATGLSQLNPSWSDEILFQEARRIVIAELQHITYNEWLPIIVGTSVMVHHRLLPSFTGFYNNYDANLNPSITSAFSTAAFRMGHSMVQGLFRLYNAAFHVQERKNLREMFNKPKFIQRGQTMNNILRFLYLDPAQRVDPFLSEELTNHLFQGDHSCGFDLASLNIQRGRDHGLPGYNSFREACGLPRARTFQDFEDTLPHQAINLFEDLYRYPDDVDLYPAGLWEHPVPGTLLGPTFLCILADQFARLKHGDRFFYDLGGQTHSFPEAQCQQIRRTSLARVICDNSSGIKEYVPLAFRTRSEMNNVVSCQSSTIPRMSLEPWREH